MSGMKKLLASSAFAAAILAAHPASAAVNIVANPGFETGTFAGWTSSGWGIDSGGLTAFDGAHYASTGCINSTYCDLSQMLSTHTGGTYTLSFAFNPGLDAGAPGDKTNADTRILWNGSVIFDIAGGNPGWDTVSIPGLMAAGSLTGLTFSGYQNPEFNGLDDVSVIQTAGGVPEPATWTMLLLGFGAIGTMLRGARGQNRGAVAAI